MTAGPFAAARSSSSRGSAPDLARLPPSFTTSIELASAAAAQDRDADPVRLAIDVELVDGDADADRARVGEAEGGDALGQGLDEVDVTHADDLLDAVYDGLVIEHL